MPRLLPSVLLWLLLSLLSQLPLYCSSLQLLAGVTNLPQLLTQTSLPSAVFGVYGARPSSNTINLTISYSLSGSGSAQGLAVQQLSSLWVSLLNERGGIRVGGVTYQYSLIWIDDGSSVPFIELVHTVFASLNDTNFMFPPWGSTNTLPVLRAATAHNKTLIAIGASSVALYNTGYRFMYGDAATANTWLSAPFAALEEASAFWRGMQTMALYYRPDSFDLGLLPSLYTWAAQRGVKIVCNVSIPWPIDSSAASVALWQQSMTQSLAPLGEIDLLVAAINIVDFSAIVPAMNALSLPISAALYANSWTDTLPSFNAQAEGWLSVFPWHAGTNYNSTLPGVAFSSTSDFARRILNASNAQLTAIHTQGVAGFEMLAAALATTQSLSNEDIRAAMLALDGYTVFNYVKLNNATLVNSGQLNQVYQVVDKVNTAVSTGASLLSEPVLPAAFPWLSYTKDGDSLELSVSGTSVLIGCALCVLGSWNAVLLMEQVIFMRRKKERQSYVWLAVTSSSLAVTALWGAEIVFVSALGLDCPHCAQSIDANKFDGGRMALGLLPALIGAWLALLLTIRDVDRMLAIIADGSARKSVTARASTTSGPGDSAIAPAPSDSTNTANSATVEAPVVRNGQAFRWLLRAALRSVSWRRSVRMIANGLSLRFVLANALLSLTFWSVRKTVTLSWMPPGQLATPVAIDVLAYIVLFCFTAPGLMVFLFATRFRPLTWILWTAGIAIDFLLTASFGEVEFAASKVGDTSAVLLTSSTVLLIATIVGVLMLVLLFGMVFNKAQVSYYSLTLALKQARVQYRKQTEQLEEERQRTNYYRATRRETNRVLSLMSLCRNRSLTLTIDQLRHITSGLYGPEGTHADSLTEQAAYEAWLEWCPTVKNKSLLVSASQKSVLSVPHNTGLLSNDELVQYDSFVPTANQLLKHPLAALVLHEHLIKSLSEENMAFLQRLDRFKQMCGDSLPAARVEMRAILNQFIVANSANQINLHDHDRRDITKKVDAAEKEAAVTCAQVFARAEKEVLQLLDTNSIRDMLQHSPTSYHFCKQILLRHWLLHQEWQVTYPSLHVTSAGGRSSEVTSLVGSNNSRNSRLSTRSSFVSSVNNAVTNAQQALVEQEEAE